MKKKNIWIAFIILLSILIILGVFIGLILKGANKAPESADGIRTKDNVSVITDKTPIDQQPLKVAEDELVFRVNPHYSKDEIIVAGILDSAPAGFIRKVVETIKEGEQYIVKTENGVLTDVFEKVHITKTFALTEDGVKEADGNNLKQAGAMYKTEKMSYIPSASRSQNTDIINIVNTMSLSSLDDNTEYPFYKEFEYAITQEVSVSGAVGFHVWLEVELDVDHGEVTFGVTAHNKSEGEIFCGCHADTEMKFEEELFHKDLPDFEFFIGVIPIVITNEIRADISGEIQLEGSIGTSFEIQSENSSGFLYSSKTNEVKEIRKKKYLSDGLQWNTEARFSGENTVNVLLHLITKLYDSTGADLSVGIEGKNKGEVRVSPQKSLDGLNYAGSIDLSISPKLQGSIVVSIPVIDQKLAEAPIFEVKLDPFWEKHWDSGKDWEKELEKLDNAPKKTELNHTYATKFGEVNAITYPQFMFDYPDNWSITQEEVIPMGETVTLSNERGIEIKFSHIGGVAEGDFERGGSATDMLRVEVSPAADSGFIPGYVQATDYSDLGKFIVAKLETTGHIDMIKGSDFTEVHGETAYAVLPESKIGTNDDVRHPFHVEFAFWYSDYISFVAHSPDGQFTKQEEKEVLAILSSFRTESSNPN